MDLICLTKLLGLLTQGQLHDFYKTGASNFSERGHITLQLLSGDFYTRIDFSDASQRQISKFLISILLISLKVRRGKNSILRWPFDIAKQPVQVGRIGQSG